MQTSVAVKAAGNVLALELNVTLAVLSPQQVDYIN